MPEAHTLPDNPVYAFTPSYDATEDVQRIRIVIQDIPGFIPTSLVALTVRDAENICDKLNRSLGHSREDWTALVARSMAWATRPDVLH